MYKNNESVMERNGLLGRIPPVTLNIIIINLLIWGACIVAGKFGIDIIGFAGLHYWKADSFNALQLVSYMFLHDTSSIWHVFFNMFSLFMFGALLERIWGSKKFMFFYFTTGIGAAIIQQLVWTFTAEADFALVDPANPTVPVIQGQEAINYALAHAPHLLHEYYNALVTVGASGAVFGILLAFGMMFPNMPMYVMFIPIPIPAKYVMIGYGAIELFCGVFNFQGSVAHFAHLGGMLFGFIILMYWRHKGDFRNNGL